MDSNKDIIRKGGTNRQRNSLILKRENLTYNSLSEYFSKHSVSSYIPSDAQRAEARKALSLMNNKNIIEAIDIYEQLVKYIKLTKENKNNQALAVWNSNKISNRINSVLNSGNPAALTAKYIEAVYEHFMSKSNSEKIGTVHRDPNDPKKILKVEKTPERLAINVFLLNRVIEKGNANSTTQDKNPQPSDFTTKDERLKNPDGSYTPFNYDSGSDDDIRGDISGDNINPRNVNEGKKRKYILSEGQFKKVISKLNG